MRCLPKAYHIFFIKLIPLLAGAVWGNSDGTGRDLAVDDLGLPLSGGVRCTFNNRAQGFGRGRGGARGIMDRARLRLGCAVTTIMRVKPCGGKVVPWLAALRGPPAGSSLASGQRIVFYNMVKSMGATL
jgi:hypothetical protein